MYYKKALATHFGDKNIGDFRFLFAFIVVP